MSHPLQKLKQNSEKSLTSWVKHQSQAGITFRTQQNNKISSLTIKHEVQKINYYKGLEEAGKNILSLDAEFTSIKI